MWPFPRKPAEPKKPRFPLYFYNTLGAEKQSFVLPAGVSKVRMYNCGPTVYSKQHIGNLSMFVFADVLRRTLEYNGFTVKQVINITDVGHLTSDADEGVDKMSKGLKQEGMALTLENMRVLGEKYTKIFQDDISRLSIDVGSIEFPRASDYIAAQIAIVKTLEEKGYAYVLADGVYYDTTRFARYGELGGIDLTGLKEGARVQSVEGKRHPTDFALWKFDKKLGWDSPWGQGFPGWHIECSAMIRKTLGEQIDIHTGGIEHIPVHHNNEIAQSEPATGKRPLSRFWMHRAHLQFEGGKLAKSAGRVVYLSDVEDRGYHPLALRYLFLGAHYRTNANFTWEALEAAQTAFIRLRSIVAESEDGGVPSEEWRVKIIERINDDLDIPGALSQLWAMTKDAALSPASMRATILEIDRILGLRLASPDEAADVLMAKLFGRALDVKNAPEDVQLLVEEREIARTGKNWAKADEIRAKLGEMGYTVEDKAEGPALRQR